MSLMIYFELNCSLLNYIQAILVFRYFINNYFKSIKNSESYLERDELKLSLIAIQ